MADPLMPKIGETWINKKTGRQMLITFIAPEDEFSGGYIWYAFLNGMDRNKNCRGSRQLRTFRKCCRFHTDAPQSSAKE